MVQESAAVGGTGGPVCWPGSHMGCCAAIPATSLDWHDPGVSVAPPDAPRVLFNGFEFLAFFAVVYAAYLALKSANRGKFLAEIG